MIPPKLLDQSNEKPHIFGDPYPGSHLHTYVRLAFIESKIHRELYSPCALKQSNADLLRVIRDSDHSLEAWRNTIPFVSRPSLVAYTGNTILNVDLRVSIFHVQYHHFMLMVHQASSRCDSWARNLDTRGTGSSLAISVTASRSLLGGFIHTPFELCSQNLLFVTYFPLTVYPPMFYSSLTLITPRFSLSYFIQASINLFCKILYSPFDTENNEDVQIIAKISQLIESNLRPMDPECYTAKVRFAAGVTYELKRLAQCAINNAGRSRNVTPRVTIDRHRGTPVPPSESYVGHMYRVYFPMSSPISLAVSFVY